MSKTQAPKPEVATQEAPAAEPTMADVMALVQSLQAQLAAAKAPAAPVADFSEAHAAAEKEGFTVQVVAPLQKGASPALRVDY